MLSLGSKSLLVFAFAAMAASIAYGVATNEGSGTVVLAFVSVGAAALFAVTLGAGPDRPPVPRPAGDGGAPAAFHNTPAGGRPLYPSVAPVLGAVAVTTLAVGAAVSAVVLVVGIVLAVLALLAWLVQAWTEHPRFTARFGVRLSDRFVVPLGLPVTVFVLVGVIAISLSRVLLAVSETGSRVVAIAVAVLILAGASVVVQQKRLTRSALSGLTGVAFVAVVAAGSLGLVHGARPFEPAAVAGPPQTLSLSASNTVSFSTDKLQAVAGHAIDLTFDNETAGVPHNVGIFDQPGGKELFAGQIVTGPTKVVYNLPALAAGSYFFHCDVHPNMNGTLVVGAAAPATNPGGAATTAPATTVPTTAAPGGAPSGGAAESTTTSTTSTTLGPVTAGYGTSAGH